MGRGKREAPAIHTTHTSKNGPERTEMRSSPGCYRICCAIASCLDTNETRTGQRGFLYPRARKHASRQAALSTREEHLRLVRMFTGNANASKETRDKTRRRPSHCGCRLHGTVRASKRVSHVPTCRSGPCHLWTAVLECAKSDLAAGQPLACLSPCQGRKYDCLVRYERGSHTPALLGHYSRHNRRRITNVCALDTQVLATYFGGARLSHRNAPYINRH